MDGRTSATSVLGWLGWLVRHCGVARYVCGRRGPVSKGASATVICCCRWVAFSIRLWIKSTVSRISRIFATWMIQAFGACRTSLRGPRAARAGHGPRGPRRDQGEGAERGASLWGGAGKARDFRRSSGCWCVGGFAASAATGARYGGERAGAGDVVNGRARCSGGCEAPRMAGPTLACGS